MHFIAMLRTVGNFFDLAEEALVSLAVLAGARKAVLLEQTLFAGEMEAGELDEPVEAVDEFIPAASLDQREPNVVHRIHQDAVLVIHRLYANRAGVIPGDSCHL